MADPVVNKMVAFNLPSPYQAEMAKIADQRRMAEMLQAQSQAPTERFSYKGIEARTPVTAGLAKALQGFGGAYFQKQAREEEKALGERYRGEQMGDMSELISGLNAPAVAAVQGQDAYTPEGSDYEDRARFGAPDLKVNEQGMVPAVAPVAARMRGQIDPSMMGRMKTQEGANQVLALVMAQRQAQIDAERRANEPYNLTGEQTRFQPMGAGIPPMVVASGVRKDDYGTTPTIVKDPLSPTGFSGFVMNSRGERKNIGPIDPVNQYTMPTVDAALKRDMDMYQFGNLSAKEKVDLGIKLTQAGVDVAKLNFDTGLGPARQPPLPANAPVPNFGGQPRPGMKVPAPVQGVRDADRIQILQEELAQNPNDIALRQELANAQSGVNYAGAGAGRTSVAPTSGAPVEMPQGMPRPAGVTPKAWAEIQAETAKGKISTEKDATTVLGLLTGVDDLIDKAHSSRLGNVFGGLQNVIGIDSDKNKADAQLAVIEGALVSRMPKMSGPQSDKDVLLYRQMAGEIGNPNISAEARKAAAEVVRGIQRAYINGFSQEGYLPANRGPTVTGTITGTVPDGAVRRIR